MKGLKTHEKNKKNTKKNMTNKNRTTSIQKKKSDK